MEIRERILTISPATFEKTILGAMAVKLESIYDLIIFQSLYT